MLSWKALRVTTQFAITWLLNSRICFTCCNSRRLEKQYTLVTKTETKHKFNVLINSLSLSLVLTNGQKPSEPPENTLLQLVLLQPKFYVKGV